MTTRPPTHRPGRPPSALARAACVRARRAFSLVELSVVLAVVAITAGVAVTRYASSLGRYRVDVAARRLAADIASIQAGARAAGAPRSLTLAAGSYTIPATVTGSRAVTVALSGSPSHTTVSRAVASTAAAAPAITSVTFDGFGQPASGAVIELTSGAHRRRVTVDASSGYVSVSIP